MQDPGVVNTAYNYIRMKGKERKKLVVTEHGTDKNGGRQVLLKCVSQRQQGQWTKW